MKSLIEEKKASGEALHFFVRTGVVRLVRMLTISSGLLQDLQSTREQTLIFFRQMTAALKFTRKILQELPRAI